MRLSIIIVIVFCSIMAGAQEKSFVKYYNDKDAEVISIDSAYYSRYYIPDTIKGSSYYIIKEFYKSERPKLIGGLYFKNGRPYFDGQLNYYDENGVLREMTNFKDGYKLGKSYHFYENRKLKKEVHYEYNTHHDISLNLLNNEDFYHESVFAKGKVIQYLDTLGNNLIVNGSGHIKSLVNYLGQTFIEEGNYKGGLKDGEWKLTSKNGNKQYVEKYKQGVFLGGYLLENALKIKYKTVIQAPRLQRKFMLNTKSVNRGVIGNDVNYVDLRALLSYSGFKYLGYSSDKDKVTVQPNLAIIVNEKGKFLDVHSNVLLPNHVMQNLRQSLAKIDFIPGEFRGEKVTMKLPVYSLNITY